MSANTNPQDRLSAALTALATATITHPLTEAQRAKLAEPLPRDVIRRLPGASGADYVDGHWVITRLNEVFGPDGWCDAYEAPTVREGPRPLVYVRGTLSAGGVTRGDVGVGVAANDKPDALETALKGAYTDCLKRNARKLGDSFGLALYEKVAHGEQRSGVGVSTTALAMQSEVRALADLGAVNEWLKANLTKVGALAADEQDLLRGEVAVRRIALRPAPQASAPEPSPAPQQAPQTPQESAPKADGALAVYRTRVDACASLGALVATALELAPTVADHRPAAWDLLARRGADLGAQPEALKAALHEGQELARDAGAWRVVAAVLVALDAAASRAEVQTIERRHGGAVQRLPKSLIARISRTRNARLAALAAQDTAVAAGLEARLRAASTIPELDVVADAITDAAKAKTISPDQARALVALHDQACAALEREPSSEAA